MKKHKKNFNFKIKINLSEDLQNKISTINSNWDEIEIRKLAEEILNWLYKNSNKDDIVLILLNPVLTHYILSMHTRYMDYKLNGSIFIVDEFPSYNCKYLKFVYLLSNGNDNQIQLREYLLFF